jgi:fucose 4-O-acetylase-like acetyltransferase
MKPEGTADVSERGGRGRMEMFDAMRGLGVIAIVWVHTPESASLQSSVNLGRWAVPFFTIGAIFFTLTSVMRKPDMSFREYARSRLMRLYIPFLGWALIYQFTRLALSVVVDGVHPKPFGLYWLWTGTTSHLWFMPFIFLVCLFVFFVAKYGRDRAVLGSFLSGGILLGCAVAFAAIRRPEWLVDFASRGVAGIYPDHPAWTTTTIGPDSQIFYTFMLAWDALPAVFWGLALAALYQLRHGRGLQHPITGALGAFLLIGSITYGCLLERVTLVENLGGVGAALLALQPWTGGVIRALAKLGPLSFGVYLAHIFLLEGYQDVFHLVHIPTIPLVDVTIFVLAVACTIITVLMLRRITWFRWLSA